MCSLCWLLVAKNHNFEQILTFGGSCTDPLLLMWAKFGTPKQTQGICKFRLDRLILSPSGGEKPEILLFFGLQHFVVSPVGSNLRKLNTVHNYEPSPIQRHQTRFCIPTPSWRNRAHKLSRSQA